MKKFSERLLDARKDKGLSQQELAKLAKVHFTNVGKYERGEAVPSANVLNRITKVLELTTDYILNGSLHDKANNTLTDHDLLVQFKKVEQLPIEKKKLIKEFLDAFVFKANVVQQLAV